jgi:hypothetical protein
MNGVFLAIIRAMSARNQERAALSSRAMGARPVFTDRQSSPALPAAASGSSARRSPAYGSLEPR